MTGIVRMAKALVVVVLTASMGACTTTHPDDYTRCATAYTLIGLGVGLLSSGTGAVIAGTAGGGGVGYLICNEEPPKIEEPEIVPVAVATAVAPVIGDADDDGVPDNRDECPNTPRDVDVDYKGCTKPLVIGNKMLHFETNKFDLPADAESVLAPVLATVERYTESKFEISGHTDWVGSEQYNQTLSENRAAAVVSFLVAHGIAPERLVVVGYGETKPVSSNETDAGRARNRRVEVRLIDN